MPNSNIYAPLQDTSRGPDASGSMTFEKPSGGSPNSRIFQPSKQTWRLFREQALRLAFTAVLVVGFIVALKVYQDHGTVTSQEKRSYNVVITVLNLALGLNFLEAFKDMAKVLRWRVLANRHHSVREADLILGGESLMKLLTLMWESRRPLTVFICTTWIALNLLAQTSIAVIGLTYSMDGGTDSTGITTRNGMVNVSKIDCYYAKDLCATRPEAAPEIVQSQAHTYGELTHGLHHCPYNSDQDIYNGFQNCTYFASQTRMEFAYRYAEYNPGDRAHAYPYLTKRIVKASAANCHEYQFTRIYDDDYQDGIKGLWIFEYHNATFNGTLKVPKSMAAFDATTYVYNGTLAPQDATVQSCGDRCISLYAYQSDGTETKRPKTFFKCDITVSEVTNTQEDAHNLSADSARLAAASIALSGRYTHEHDQIQWQQYQLYPWGSDWETNGLTAEMVGSRMSEFAIGSVAAMALLNPQTTIRGTLPTLGYQLNIEWQYVIALAACIGGIHLLLVGLMLWIARPIVITDDSNLAVARLLKGLVEPLGHEGGLLDGTEIAEAIQQEEEVKVGYGVREGETGTILEISDGLQSRKRLPGRKFPTGTYA